ETEDGQILNGNGSGENLRGILQTSGRLTFNSPSTELVENDGMKIVEGVKRAKTKVRVEGRASATAVVMHPNDAETVYLARVAKNPAIDGSADGNLPIAGLVPVETEVIPEGKALVGDFRKAVLWDRESAVITVTDSHADFFIRNLVAVLAEQ